MREDIIEHMLENGPTAIKDLPYSEPPRRFDGVKEFDISASQRNSDGKTGGVSHRIAYIESEHTNEDVFEAWCEENAGVIERASPETLYRATPKEFRDVFREFIDVTLNNHGGKRNFGGVCSLCGEEYEGTLPKHLRNDCDG